MTLKNKVEVFSFLLRFSSLFMLFSFNFSPTFASKSIIKEIEEIDSVVCQYNFLEIPKHLRFKKFSIEEFGNACSGNTIYRIEKSHKYVLKIITNEDDINANRELNITFQVGVGGFKDVAQSGL